MKTRRNFLKKSALMLAAGTLPVSAFSISRKPEAQEVVVTLFVDTGSIQKPNESNYCNFGQADGVSNEEFTIVANVGDTITWRGVSSSAPSTDVVSVVAINYEGGKNVFGSNVLKDTPQNPGTVSGQVRYRTGDQFCKYKIMFTVTNSGTKRGGTYQIDPKIEVH